MIVKLEQQHGRFISCTRHIFEESHAQILGKEKIFYHPFLDHDLVAKLPISR
jgi:hypothetical protein